MKQAETEVVYTVHYQQKGKPDWYVFTNDRFVHRPKNSVGETFDFAEAETAARELLTREQFTDSRPKYQYPIVATRVVQRIATGGTIITHGQPIGE